MEEFPTRLCTFGVNRSTPGSSRDALLSISKSIDGFLKCKKSILISENIHQDLF
jgi:hypothetical protein